MEACTEENEIPAASIDTAMWMWRNFKETPSDEAWFNEFDWHIRVAMAKWEAYATERRKACK